MVPNNGSDGNSDGVADIFDVRIDGGKADMSAVAGGRAHFEIANLSIDLSDSLELIHPLGFVLSSPDDGAEILNHGVLRVGMAAFVSPSLLFEGDHLQLSGSGTLQLGLVAGHRATSCWAESRQPDYKRSGPYDTKRRSELERTNWRVYVGVRQWKYCVYERRPSGR